MHDWLVVSITVVTLPVVILSIVVVMNWDLVVDNFVNNLVVLSNWL